MGTNYYWHEDSKCPTCGKHRADTVHIGKSSAGWVFALHVYPDDGIHDLSDWVGRFAQGGSVIRDEYGMEIPPSRMKEIICDRGRTAEPLPHKFYSENHALPGPNGLVRRKIGAHCVRHGEGTWDCVVGNFS